MIGKKDLVHSLTNPVWWPLLCFFYFFKLVAWYLSTSRKLVFWCMDWHHLTVLSCPKLLVSSLPPYTPSWLSLLLHSLYFPSLCSYGVTWQVKLINRANRIPGHWFESLDLQNCTHRLRHDLIGNVPHTVHPGFCRLGKMTYVEPL